MTATTAPGPATPRASFWQRRLLGPLRSQLTRGVAPDRLAFTLAVGTACSLLPFLGFTSLLNLVVGFCLRLNQPILQVLNQLLGPLQLLLIVAYVRLGELIWRAEPMPLAVSTLISSFRADPGAFMVRFGWTGVHAATAWGLTAPLLIAALYLPLRTMVKMAGRKQAGSAT